MDLYPAEHVERDGGLPAGGIVTILLAIFVVPRFLPDQPERPITAIGGASSRSRLPSVRCGSSWATVCSWPSFSA